MGLVRISTVHVRLTGCWVKWEGVTPGYYCWLYFVIECCKISAWHIAHERVWPLYDDRCMASSLVRTGFVRGSMPQGNGCYQHRCKNNLLEVCLLHLFFLVLRCFYASLVIFSLSSTNAILLGCRGGRMEILPSSWWTNSVSRFQW